MKTARLLAYGAAGIIAGLLLENKAIVLKGKAKAGAGKLKKKVSKLVHSN
mgnify:CR=1 FL=1